MSPTTFSSPSSRVAFVDTTVQGYEQIVAGLSPQTNVVLLGEGRDAIAQITETLASSTDVDSVQIFSHGDAGLVQLAGTTLSNDTLPQYRDALQQWSSALSEDADILFYGCNVAAGDVGQDFVAELAQLTGADIAASDDLTGHSSLGGD